MVKLKKVLLIFNPIKKKINTLTINKILWLDRLLPSNAPTMMHMRIPSTEFVEETMAGAMTSCLLPKSFHQQINLKHKKTIRIFQELCYR